MPIETDGHAVPKERQRDMTAFAIPSPAHAAPRGGFRRVARAFNDWNMNRITKRQLARLDPHLMRDIGLTPPPPNPDVDLMWKARAQW